MSKERHEEAAQGFAQGASEKPAQPGKAVNLGQHTAVLDEASGTLTLFEAGTSMKLSADEAYHLLAWLNDNYRDRLSTLAGHTQQAHRSTPDYDVGSPQQEHEWWEWAHHASDDELLAALRNCPSWSVTPAHATRTALQERGYILVGEQPHEVTLQRRQEENP
ncbi:MAG TPA: hypothetical protein VKV40_06725 [Ktedonobacteraceae bacterium]|nr:hypothetical protein [Ktedonobacteraceae bacterium]